MKLKVSDFVHDMVYDIAPKQNNPTRYALTKDDIIRIGEVMPKTEETSIDVESFLIDESQNGYEFFEYARGILEDSFKECTDNMSREELYSMIKNVLVSDYSICSSNKELGFVVIDDIMYCLAGDTKSLNSEFEESLRKSEASYYENSYKMRRGW